MAEEDVKPAVIQTRIRPPPKTQIFIAIKSNEQEVKLDQKHGSFSEFSSFAHLHIIVGRHAGRHSFFVNAGALASHSSFFKELLYKIMPFMHTLNINSVSAQDFLMFLRALMGYPQPLAISGDNIVALTDLSLTFDAKPLYWSCEKYILQSRHIGMDAAEKLLKVAYRKSSKLENFLLEYLSSKLTPSQFDKLSYIDVNVVYSLYKRKIARMEDKKEITTPTVKVSRKKPEKEGSITLDDDDDGDDSDCMIVNDATKPQLAASSKSSSPLVMNSSQSSDQPSSVPVCNLKDAISLLQEQKVDTFHEMDQIMNDSPEQLHAESSTTCIEDAFTPQVKTEKTPGKKRGRPRKGSEERVHEYKRRESLNRLSLPLAKMLVPVELLEDEDSIEMEEFIPKDTNYCKMNLSFATNGKTAVLRETESGEIYFRPEAVGQNMRFRWTEKDTLTIDRLIKNGAAALLTGGDGNVYVITGHTMLHYYKLYMVDCKTRLSMHHYYPPSRYVQPPICPNVTFPSSSLPKERKRPLLQPEYETSSDDESDYQMIYHSNNV